MKKEPEKPQKQKFIETARALGCDESGEKFEEAMTKVLKTEKTKPKA